MRSRLAGVVCAANARGTVIADHARLSDVAKSARPATIDIGLPLLGNGDGTFAANVDYTMGLNPEDVTAEDFNGDGKPDLAAANYGGNAVNVLLNNGDGTSAANVDYPAGTGPGSVKAGDPNGDGNVDIAVGDSGSDRVSVLVDQGDGTFAAHVTSVAAGSKRDTKARRMSWIAATSAWLILVAFKAALLQSGSP